MDYLCPTLISEWSTLISEWSASISEWSELISEWSALISEWSVCVAAECQQQTQNGEEKEKKLLSKRLFIIK